MNLTLNVKNERALSTLKRKKPRDIPRKKCAHTRKSPKITAIFRPLT